MSSSKNLLAIPLYAKGMKHKRIIDFLRVRYPEVQWKWDTNMRCWQASDGSCVRAVHALAPQYDGDDESFIKQYYRYFNGEKAPELIF